MARSQLAGLVLAALLIAGCATPEVGKVAEPAPPEPRRANELGRVVRHMEAKQYDRVIDVLLRLQERQGADEAAATHYLLGSAYAGKADYQQAAAHYAAVAHRPGRGMAPEVVTAARLGAGHYSFLAQRYQDVVRHLAAWWREAVEPPPGTLMELAQAYGHVGDHAQAVVVAEAAMQAAEARGAAILEQWLAVLADLYYANEQWEKSLAVHDRLEREFPIDRSRRRELLPDSETLRALQAQSRALLRR